jgi:hypothetical protein
VGANAHPFESPLTLLFSSLGRTNANAAIRTVMDNLFDRGTIQSNVFSMYFEPAPSSGRIGELTFGGTDPTKYNGSITFV